MKLLFYIFKILIMPRPRYNSKTTAKKQRKQQTKMATEKYDWAHHNKVWTDYCNNKVILDTIKKIEEKTKPYVKLIAGMKKQGRLIGGQDTRTAYILDCFWILTKMLIGKRDLDEKKYTDILKSIECILLVMKHKYQHKNHVADTLLQNFVEDKVIAPCGSDHAFSEFRYLYAARHPESLDVNAFISVRECIDADVFKKIYKVDIEPYLVEYAFVDKEFRRKGAFASLMMGLSGDIAEQGHNGDIVLIVENDNEAMLSAMKRFGAKKIWSTEDGALYHVNMVVRHN